MESHAVVNCVLNLVRCLWDSVSSGSERCVAMSTLDPSPTAQGCAAAITKIFRGVGGVGKPTSSYPSFGELSLPYRLPVVFQTTVSKYVVFLLWSAEEISKDQYYQSSFILGADSSI